MMAITNPKLSGFAPDFTPCWAPFPGFSLLFDNPDGCLVDRDDWLELHVNAEDSALALYKKLDAGLKSLDTDSRPFHENGFAPLPLESHHVTVWDGINQANVLDVTVGRENWQKLLSGLPQSLVQHRNLLKVVELSPLVSESWRIRFILDSLHIWTSLKVHEGISTWSGAALVAALKPTDETSEVFDLLKEKRLELNTAFKNKVGQVDLREDYTPHVSLGYFANEERAIDAQRVLTEWSQTLKEHVADTFLEVNSIRVYGFHDMARFFTFPKLSDTPETGG